MSESVGVIYYEVEAETSKLVNSGHQVDGSLGKMQAQFSKTDKAASATQFQMTKTASAVQELGRQAQAAQNPLGGMNKLLGGLLTLQGANSLIQMAEGYGEMAERVRMATSSVDEYEMVQARLLDTANGTYRSMKEAQELYILTGDTLRSMGYSTEQALDVVDSLSYAFVKNATSQERAQSAISAFTNSMMKGKVEADSWSSIIAAVPSVINDLAASTGKTAAEIRELGASGKIAASMLSGGLLNSLNENKAAADGMATTVKDAFTQLRNNLAMYVGEANMANGATGLLSKSIMLFGQNIDTVVNLLMTLGAGALAKYIVSMGAATVASGRAVLAARAQTAENLRLAQSNLAAATAAEANAVANVALGGSLAQLGVASRATAAAQAELALAQKAAQAAGAGFLGILGGPAGIIALVASAAAGVYLFGKNSSAAVADVDKLREGIDKLSISMIQQRKIKARDSIDILRKDAAAAATQVDLLEKQVSRLSIAKANPKEIALMQDSLINARVEAENTHKALREMQDAGIELANAESKITSPTSVSSPEQKADPDAAKRIKGMEDELALLKVTGAARKELQALQQLGSNATAEQIDRAKELAAQLYAAEQAEKSRTKASTDGASAAKKSADEQKKLREEEIKGRQKIDEQIGELSIKLAQVAMTGREVAMMQAAIAAGEYATPEQIAALQQLNGLLYDAEQRKANMDKIMQAGGVDNYVGGPAEPITGGPFDTQDARFAAEEEKELERYRLKAVRLAEAHDATEMSEEEHYRRIESLAQEHKNRMGQIEEARTKLMLDSTVGSLSDMTGSLKSAFGEQSGIYKAAFAVQKAASIAQSIVAIQTGIAQASALPFPANIPAMASVAAATAGIISTISGTNISGGRQYGGPVSAGKMYRINETGAPEVLNMANGQQFMLPNSRGEVVSNKNATSGGGSSALKLTVNLIGAPEGTTVEQRQVGDEEFVLNVMMKDVMRGGRHITASQAVSGTRRVGR